MNNISFLRLFSRFRGSGSEDGQHLIQDPEQQLLSTRKDVWSPIGYYAKLDVLKFLRPNDIRKICIFVNRDWSRFCVDNKNYLPKPGPREQEEENEKIRAQQRRDELKRQKWQYRRNLCFFFLVILAGCLANTFLVLKIKADESSVYDVIPMVVLAVLSCIFTYIHAYDTDTDIIVHPYRWFTWLCFRDILAFAGLAASHISTQWTPSETTFWIVLLIVHLRELFQK